MKNISRTKAKQKRHQKIRQTIIGTQLKPRLCVFRSNKHIFAQIIDDTKGNTLVCASTLKSKNGSNIKAASEVGTSIGKKAKAQKIKEVVFDRGGNLYHGRVKSLAEAARKEGLKF